MLLSCYLKVLYLLDIFRSQSTLPVVKVSWPSWLRHRANNAGISGSIPLETIFKFFLHHFYGVSVIYTFIIMKVNKKLCSIIKNDAQARNRTGGPTMATLDFTTKPLALSYCFCYPLHEV